MDIPLSIPPALVPIFLGAIALGVGAMLVEMANLIVQLIGLVLALGGVTFLLTPVPDDVLTSDVKAIVVTVVFVGLSAVIARTGSSKRRGAIIAGAVLVVLGILAFVVQLDGYNAWPGGTLGDIIDQGFDALSRIFGLSSKAID